MSGTKSRCGSSGAALAVLLAILFTFPATADGQNGAGGQNDAAAAHGPLDGMRFVGDFGPKGEAADREDTLYFADGKFWSKNCVPCGFSPGPYWVRYTEDGIHFKGELRSPESGRFFYSGVVQDGRLEVSINWRKERWYWTIDRDFRFEGELVPVTPVGGMPSAARVAMAAASEPRVCEP